MAVHYLEIVSNDVDNLTALYSACTVSRLVLPTPISGRLVWRPERTELW
jgi:hypothetical protein